MEKIKARIISVNQKLFDAGFTVTEVLKFWKDVKKEVKKPIVNKNFNHP